MTLDPPYVETDRISPHYGHHIQPLGEGAWLCTSCDRGALADWKDEHLPMMEVPAALVEEILSRAARYFPEDDPDAMEAYYALDRLHDERRGT